jgi:Flp pilus assembly protein TadG
MYSMLRKIELRSLDRILRCVRGSQLIEFSFSILLLLAMVFGIMDFSRAMYSYHFVSYAAQEGTRYAIVRGADWKTSCSTSAPPNFALTFKCNAASSDVQNYIKSFASPGINPSNITVTTSWPGTTPDCTSSCSACTTVNSQGCLVKVKVNYRFSFITSILPGSSSLNFAGTSEKVIQK